MTDQYLLTAELRLTLGQKQDSTASIKKENPTGREITAFITKKNPCDLTVGMTVLLRLIIFYVLIYVRMKDVVSNSIKMYMNIREDRGYSDL